MNTIKNQSYNITLKKNIKLSKIVYKNKRWQYTYTETNKFGIIKIEVFFSINFDTILEHRNELIRKIEKSVKSHQTLGYTTTDLKPSINHQIAEAQKTR